MKAINLNLSLDEVNQILQALGEQPFHSVHQLIADIHQQAQSQVSELEDTDAGAAASSDIEVGEQT